MISFSRKPDKVKSYGQVHDWTKAKLALATLLLRMPEEKYTAPPIKGIDCEIWVVIYTFLKN